ncbi:hypothetical protein EV175_000775 [Coemansia sp. RSA 1933]|nr:hypothetical protein EV175_000775 [Coemansia sp. RSA 1933]
MQRSLIPITLVCMCCWLAAVAQGMVAAVSAVAEEAPEEDAISSQADPESHADGSGAGAFIGLQPDEMSMWVEEQENHGDGEPLADQAPLGDAQRHVDDIEDLRTAEFISAIVVALENNSNWRMPPPPSEQMKHDDDNGNDDAKA